MPRAREVASRSVAFEMDRPPGAAELASATLKPRSPAGAIVPFDAFRQDLAARLIHQVGRRRRLSPYQAPTAEDRKVIALLERLAEDVRNLDLHVFLIFQSMLSTTHLARRYGARRNELFARIGVTYRPVDATDLVRWMTWTIVEDDRLPSVAGDAPRPVVAEGPGGFAASERRVLAHALSRPFHVLPDEGRLEWGIVVAFLVFWAVVVGIGQWRDRAFMEAHPAVSALVVSTEAFGGGKSSGVALNVLLDFTPSPAAAPCRSQIRVDFLPRRPAPGESIDVVPRSGKCEPPLFPQRIGNPLVSFAFAAFLAGGWVLASVLGRPRRSGPLASRVSSGRPGPLGG